jgi:hypothetical protein
MDGREGGKWEYCIGFDICYYYKNVANHNGPVANLISQALALDFVALSSPYGLDFEHYCSFILLLNYDSLYGTAFI